VLYYPTKFNGLISVIWAKKITEQNLKRNLEGHPTKAALKLNLELENKKLFHYHFVSFIVFEMLICCFGFLSKLYIETADNLREYNAIRG